jgi:hypothetical protein
MQKLLLNVKQLRIYNINIILMEQSQNIKLAYPILTKDRRTVTHLPNSNFVFSGLFKDATEAAPLPPYLAPTKMG